MRFVSSLHCPSVFTGSREHLDTVKAHRADRVTKWEAIPYGLSAKSHGTRCSCLLTLTIIVSSRARIINKIKRAFKYQNSLCIGNILHL